jgi:hypothetical protein
LLEEEEEKKEEEERRERKRVKDREKKQRRKGKDRDQKEKEELAAADAKSEEGGLEDGPVGDSGGKDREEGDQEGANGEKSEEEVRSPSGAESQGLEEGEGTDEDTVAAAESPCGGVVRVESEGEEEELEKGGEETTPRGVMVSVLQGKSGGVILDRQVNAVGKKVAALSLEKRVEQKGKENGRQTAGVKLPKAKSSAPIVSSSGTGGVKILVRSIPSVLASSNTKGAAGKTGAKGGATPGGKSVGVSATAVGKGVPAVTPAVTKVAAGTTGASAGVAAATKGAKGLSSVHGQRIVVSGTGSSANGVAPSVAKAASNGRALNAPATMRSVVNGTTGGLRVGSAGSGSAGNSVVVNGMSPGVRNGLPGAAGSSASTSVIGGSVLRAGPQVIRATSLPGSTVSSGVNGGTTTIITQVAPGVTVATKRPSSNPSPNPALGEVHGRAGVKTGGGYGATQSPVTSTTEAQARVPSGQVPGGVNGHVLGSVNGNPPRSGARLTSWASGIRNPVLVNNKVIRVGPSNVAAVPLSRANSASSIPVGGYGQQGRSPPGTGTAPGASPGSTPSVARGPVLQHMSSTTPPSTTPPQHPLSSHGFPLLGSRTPSAISHSPGLPHDPAPFLLGHPSVNVPYQNGGPLSGFQRSMSVSEGAMRGNPPVGSRDHNPGAGVRAVIGSLALDLGVDPHGGEGAEYGARSLGREENHYPERAGLAGQQQPTPSFKAPGPASGRFGASREMGRDGMMERGANGFPPSANGHIWGPDFSLFSFAAPPENSGKGLADGEKRDNEGAQGEYSLFASAGGGFGFF